MNGGRTIKKVLIYSEDHEAYLQSFITLLRMVGDMEIIVATAQKRIDYMLKTNPRFYSSIKFVGLMDRCSIRTSPSKAIYNVTTNYNSIQEAFRTNKPEVFIVMEMYDEMLKFLLSHDLNFKNVKKVLTIHNIHQYLKVNDNDAEKYGLKNVRLKKYQNRFMRKFDKYTVMDGNVKMFLMNCYKINAEVLPYKVTNSEFIRKRYEFLSISKREKPRLLVPGAVQSSRRDYKKIIDTFSEIRDHPYELVFIGKIYESWVVEYAAEKKVKIKYIEDYLTEEEFNEEAIHSHFILDFVPQHSPYGTLKVSGAQLDGFTLGVPIVVNKKEMVSENGEFIYADNLTLTLQQILSDYEDGKYVEKYGLPALEKMKKNIPENYIETVRKLLEV